MDLVDDNIPLCSYAKRQWKRQRGVLHQKSSFIVRIDGIFVKLQEFKQWMDNKFNVEGSQLHLVLLFI